MMNLLAEVERTLELAGGGKAGFLVGIVRVQRVRWDEVWGLEAVEKSRQGENDKFQIGNNQTKKSPPCGGRSKNLGELASFS